MCCDEAKVNSSGFAVYISDEGEVRKEVLLDCRAACDHVRHCSAVRLPHHVHHLQELISSEQIYLGT